MMISTTELKYNHLVRRPLDIQRKFGHNRGNFLNRKAKTEESKIAGNDREAEAQTETSTREKLFEVPS